MAKRSPWAGLLKLGVSLAAIGYVAWRLWDDRDALVEAWLALDGLGWAMLAAAVLLVAPNVGLEAGKWRMMVKEIYPELGLGKAVRAVLAGMASGIFTPNRIGEYAGRVLYLEKGRRVEAIVATFVDRICQMGVTLAAGCAAFGVVFQMDSARLQHVISPESDQFIFWISLASLGVFLAFVIAPSFVSRLIPESWTRWDWLRQVKVEGARLRSTLLLRVFALSALRYATFLSQYILLLLAMGMAISLGEALVCCALVFLLKSVVPLPGIMELGVRETVALAVFGAFGFADAPAVQATFLLYLVNIVLPTLAGVWALQGIQANGGGK